MPLSFAVVTKRVTTTGTLTTTKNGMTNILIQRISNDIIISPWKIIFDRTYSSFGHEAHPWAITAKVQLGPGHQPKIFQV